MKLQNQYQIKRGRAIETVFFSLRGLLEKACSVIPGFSQYLNAYQLVLEFRKVVEEVALNFSSVTGSIDPGETLRKLNQYCEKLARILTQLAAVWPSFSSKKILNKRLLKPLQEATHKLNENLLSVGLGRVFYETLKARLINSEWNDLNISFHSRNHRKTLEEMCWQISNYGQEPIFFLAYSESFLEEISTSLKNYFASYLRCHELKDNEQLKFSSELCNMAQIRRHLANLLFQAWQAQINLELFLSDPRGFDFWKLNDMIQRNLDASAYSGHEQNFIKVYSTDAHSNLSALFQQIKNIFASYYHTETESLEALRRYNIVENFQKVCSLVFYENYDTDRLIVQIDDARREPLILFKKFIAGLFEPGIDEELGVDKSVC